MISVVNLRNKISENHNLARLLKDVNNKLTVFNVTEIYQDIFESTVLDSQNFIYLIDDCKVVVIILNVPLKYYTDEHSIYFFFIK